ncbi:hypothetical protein VTK26DRAFT_7191 [Humicola hyalothermophila]
MLSALLRPFQGTSSHDKDLADPEQDFAARPSTAEYRRYQHATADFTEADDDDEESNNGEPPRYPLGGRAQQDEDGLGQSTGILPLFSSGHLDSIPIYSLTHAIRILVQARTETTLTWEQLRSPQVSQFLVKPMQQQIRTQHFSLGTLYALMANCLQFEKEAHLHPANAGASGTRARVCELLAIKLLKEYTTRDLVDALCYDFYPLQGIPGSQSPLAAGGSGSKTAGLRTSTLEVAIRASAKNFLSHPLIIQQLEAIWNGAISFHRTPQAPQPHGSAPSAAGSSQSRRQSTVLTPLLGNQSSKEDLAPLRSRSPGRRSVTLYDPRTASVFRLSRLRVPRYRRILSTCSLLVLMCLFLAVLGQRSSRITKLELLFWFWSAGFMLDEIVGFNEEGFSFYVMNFWNIFDLGSLLLLIVYYCMRIYGVFLLDPHKWNQNAYDVLAVNAILLLPRIFGVLDHYRYFSRLLIALRLLAIDFAAVCLLILICCSAFFAFFVFSRTQQDPSALAYNVFQIFVGFTPAAWDMWPTYGWIGKTLTGLFLVVCHFVVITLLVTVLTNSFMSIASRTSQEYQFCFAINTISMIKNDTVFAYVAPSNIFAWALLPLRYCMALDQYVWLNRLVIQVTHCPLLFCIYLYEKYFLASDMYEATDLVDKPRRRRHATLFADPVTRSAFFSPSIRICDESVFGYQKDRVLEEVFRRAPDMRTQRRNERRKTQNAIRSWMDQHGGGYHSPQNYSTINSRVTSDWNRRLSMNRDRPSRFPKNYSDIKSAASDPADFASDAPYPIAPELYRDGIARRDHAVEEVKDVTDGDADGDDELVTNDEEEEDNATNNLEVGAADGEQVIDEDYFTTPVATRFANAELTSADSPRPPTMRRMPLHARTLSTNTILYAPEDADRPYSSSSASVWPTISRPLSRPISNRPTPVTTPITRDTARRSPRRSLYLAHRSPRPPAHPGASMARTAPNRAALALDIPTNSTSTQRPGPARRRSMADLLAATTTAENYLGLAFPEHDDDDDDVVNYSNQRMSKLMLAKMKLLEESLGDMVREMRVLRKSVPGTGTERHGSDGAEGGYSVGEELGEEEEVAGSGSKSSWGGKQARFFPGSDPSSLVSNSNVVGASSRAAVIEIAQGRRGEKDGLRSGGGLRRAKTTTPRKSGYGYGGGGGGRRTGGGGPGIWRSPREDREEATGYAGLGIKDAGRTAKGKERESGVRHGKGREVVEGQREGIRSSDDYEDGGGGGFVDDSPAMSPDGDGIGGLMRGCSV